MAESRSLYCRGVTNDAQSLEADRFTQDLDVDLLSLDEALDRFALDYPRESKIVELRFFGGLSIADVARVMKVSDSTVERDWRFARAWLLQDLSGE